MIPWWGAVVALFVGVFVGIALIAIVTANMDD